MGSLHTLASLQLSNGSLCRMIDSSYMTQSDTVSAAAPNRNISNVTCEMVADAIMFPRLVHEAPRQSGGLPL